MVDNDDVARSLSARGGPEIIPTADILRLMPWSTRLHDSVWWTSRDGEAKTIAEMDIGHAHNAFGWLVRNRQRIHYVVGQEMFLGPLRARGDMAQMAEEEAMDEWWSMSDRQVHLWLLDQPVMKALAARIQAEVG